MPDGHVTLNIGGLKLDCSSNFIIPNINDILAKQNITVVDEMQKELYSRDFTCNALLMSMDLKHIFDPLGRGIADIKKRIIKTCLSPEITLGYDNKRVVRILYLAAKLNFEVAPEIISWVKKNPASFSNVKSQYLTKKLIKALAYDPEKVIKLITDMNLWPYIPTNIKILQPYILKNI
jgi:poly(A) polymerase